MTKKFKIKGLSLTFQETLGAGGQGEASKVTADFNPHVPLVFKSMPNEPKGYERAQGLVDLSLPTLSPYLSAPVVVDIHKGKIRHLSPFAPGNDLENDRPRTFAENMEIAHHLECQACILEENSLAHGDYAPANIKISDDGGVSLIDFDNLKFPNPKFPEPQMAGQAMMMAPELRNGKTGITIESDRFSRAVLQNMILLGRHPAEGLVKNPAERNKIMSQGLWPERQRLPEPDETPIKALGNDIAKLFDLAFSLDPIQRPSADLWRKTLLRGLHNIYIHDCGQAFVADNKLSQCPWCHQEIDLPDTNLIIKIKVKGSNIHYKVPLEDGIPLVIGRGNVSTMSGMVSTRHLQITRTGSKIHIKHIGRNPSQLWSGGVWSSFDKITLDEAILRRPVHLQLADSRLEIRVV